MSGGVDFHGHGGALEAGRIRRGRRHAATLWTTARRSRRRAPAAPARTFTTPAPPPRRSACRTMCWTMKAVFREGGDRGIRRRLSARRETPIPCVRCNQTVKFHDLLETARDPGGRGHGHGTLCAAAKPAAGGRSCTGRSIQRARPILFPVRHHARSARFRALPARWLCPSRRCGGSRAELGLSVADKPDSQDICFVPEGKYTTVIDRLRPQGAIPGEIVHVDGPRCSAGTRGVTRYTVGQRRGPQHRRRRPPCSWCAWTPRRGA